MPLSRPTIHSRKGVVSSGHYLATSAGLRMFACGGNAIDAGVAAGFALAVLKPQQNSLGGECPILIYNPTDKNVMAVSGQGTAPGKATIKWFKDNNIGMIPGEGLLAATVPGMFGSYATALLKFGRLTLRQVLEPAFELAESGFPVYSALHGVLCSLKDKFINEWPTSAQVFIPEGKVPDIGEILKQPALANTFRSLMEAEDSCRLSGREAAINNAIKYFYKGEIAQKILEFATNNPFKDSSEAYHTTLLEKEDFDAYKTGIEKPVSACYKKYKVFKCGPWTQGPVFLQQLKLLEGFDLKNMGHNSGEYIHTVIECSKLAFADRDRYYGDPEFSRVPMEMLLSEEYNMEQRKKIKVDKANNSAIWSETGKCDDTPYRGDTTHLDAADQEGFMISATPSGAWIPSSPVIPTLGFPLGTRAQVFNLKEGHPNCLAPGKRPRTTLTPSIAFKDGEPWIAFGTPGGDIQDQWTLQYFLNLAEFGMDMQKAIDAPTFHTTHFINSFYPHETGDGTIFVEEGIDKDALFALQNKGHKIHLDAADSHGEVCSVCLNREISMVQGAASPKSEGNSYVMGW